MNMKKVTVYTDGACSGNPGPGGWAAILRYGNHEKCISGGEIETTNNRMELTAAIRALECLKEPCEVTLCSDSRYVIDGLQKKWAEGWKNRGWIKSNREPALNPDLWDSLLALTARHEMTYVWIRGHASDSFNNRCDAMAVEERDRKAALCSIRA